MIETTMNDRNKEIIKQLRQIGYKPRNNKDINNYIKQLRNRLRKQNKDLYIEENEDNLRVFIGEKKPIMKKTKALYVKINDEEEMKYKTLAKKRNKNLSELIRDLLDKECLK